VEPTRAALARSVAGDEMCWSTRLVLVMEVGGFDVEMCWSTRLLLVMEAGGFDVERCWSTKVLVVMEGGCGRHGEPTRGWRGLRGNAEL
jgi:hypothetical protein